MKQCDKEVRGKEKVYEYGGYLTIDSSGEEYFTQLGIEEKYIVRLNAARYAIVESIKDSGCDIIWIPVYMCQTVFDAIKNAGIKFKVYHIDREGFPLLDSIKDKEMILATNYCGIKSDDYYESIQHKYRKVIFDNTQAFYAKPMMGDYIYNIYSPRKFFGVPDGAYLISNHVMKISECVQDVSYVTAMYLFKAIEEGTNATYVDYMENEKRISQNGTSKMSKLTRHLLSNVDYSKIETVRKENYRYLDSVFSKINYWGGQTESTPMVYPLLLQQDTDRIRENLVKNGIYVSQWWKWVLEEKNANEYEKELSRNLLPIPIDQRYTIDDMKRMARLILDILNKGG
jgi:hypothetical protein